MFAQTACGLACVTCLACVHPAPLPPQAIALNREGASAIASGDLENAEARLALALEYNPRFTEAWVNLGIVELQRGNFERALAAFAKARDLNPDLSTPHHALGLLAERDGRMADAERYYRAALKVDPGFAPARINLGRSLFARGALEEAREQFLRLTEVAPTSLDGWTGLCESLLRLDRLGDASRVLSKAETRFGPVAPLEILRARLLLRGRALEDAVATLEPLTVASDPRQAASAFAWLAVTRLAQGDEAGAADAARHATSMNPEDGVARYALKASTVNAYAH